MARGKTTGQFIAEAKAVHGDEYDYSRVDYVNSKTPIEIVCATHGGFWQLSYNHLNGQGCPVCGKLKQAENRRWTTSSFVQKAQAVHSDRYDYSKVEYKESSSKIEIICPAHGTFQQTPNSHVSGQGCPKCGRLKAAANHRNTTADFIAKAVSIHGDFYDYSRVEYTAATAKVEIICPKHGSFMQTAITHLSGRGCSECGREATAESRRLTKSQFIAKARAAHGHRYDYSQVDFVDGDTPVQIVCSEHGVFSQKPTRHHRGQGCPRCAGTVKLTTEEFIERARDVHGDRYDYSKAIYQTNHETVKIVCPKHGSFLQVASTHLSGAGCARCAGNAKSNTADFILRAKKVHGDRFNYTSVEYTNSTTKVSIICPEHGAFTQVPSSHLAGAGCPHCAGNTRSNTESFIEKAQEVHGDRYLYDKVAYVNTHSDVQIECQEHGIFMQTPSKHLSGQGCPRCSRSVVDKESFIDAALKVHGDIYDYSSVEYCDSTTPVQIICPEHGTFAPRPANHVQGTGCPKCAGNAKLDTSEFILRATEIHGDRYDYCNTYYVNQGTRVDIICPEHGNFSQLAGNHLAGSGCPQCFGTLPLDTEQFVAKAVDVHGDRYDYSASQYVNAVTKLEISCPDHGRFLQNPSSHLAGRGCPDCHHPSDMDAIYIWRLKEYAEHHGRLCFKVGVTSNRRGIARIEEVGRKSPYTPVDIRLFSVDDAMAVESLLKQVGEWSQLTGFDGATECRLFTPLEYQRALTICMDGGTEIDIP